MTEPITEYKKDKMHEKYTCTGKCKEFKDMTLPEINTSMKRGVFLTFWELLFVSVGIAYLARKELTNALGVAAPYGDAILAVALIFFLSRNRK